MAAMPILTFADGSTTALPEGEPVGCVLPKGSRRGAGGWRARVTSRSCPTDDVEVEPVDARSDDGLHVLRHSTAHVLAQAVCDIFPGTAYAIGPAIEDGFYYDFDLAGAVSRTTCRRSTTHAADRETQPAVPSRGGCSRRSQGSTGGPAVQARDHRGLARPRGAVDIVSLYRNDGWDDLCLGPHVPSHRRAGRLQAHVAGGRVLARRRHGPAAHPHLRHRMGDAGRPRRLPSPPRGSRAPRPPQARRRARPVLLPRGDRLGAGGVPPPRRADPPAHGGLLAPPPRGGRVRVRLLAAHHQVGPVRDERPPDVVRRRHVPADGARRRHASTT